MSAERAAWIILDGIAAGQREIPVAEGAELDILIARARDPERAFAALSAQGARLAAARGR
jgi:dehydrogenase/reductase SDR family protein 7B